jgi:hypothetical protein
MSRANPPPTAREKIMANAIRVLLTAIDGADEQRRHYRRFLRQDELPAVHREEG